MFETKYRYVFPTPPKLKGKIDKKYNRLYAFPSTPEEPAENGFVILDSGAFGLSKYKGKMTPAYMEKLANHYAKYPNQNYIKVAPDVSKNPTQTMQNYLYWKRKGYPNVSPVLQFENRNISNYELDKQLDFYSKQQELDFILIAKRGNKGVDLRTQNISNKLLMIKEKYNIKWVHFLAAGWNINDCIFYSEMIQEGGLDSIDTIAYYNCANSDDANQKDWGNSKGNFDKNVMANIETINQIMKKI